MHIHECRERTVMSQGNLTEADIPGASLCGWNPGDLKAPELKCIYINSFLLYYNGFLLYYNRVQAYIVNG